MRHTITGQWCELHAYHCVAITPPKSRQPYPAEQPASSTVTPIALPSSPWQAAAYLPQPASMNLTILSAVHQ